MRLLHFVRNDREHIVQMLNIIRYAVITIFLIAVAACTATSPWHQEQADAHLNIGHAYLGEERFNDALKEYMLAEDFTPNDPKVHYHMGIAYHRKGLNDKAIAEFKKALSLNSDYSEVHNFLGAIYLEMGLWDNAIESFNNALSNSLYETPDKAIFNMAKAYHGKGDYQKALKAYEEAKNKKPNTIPRALIDHQMGLTFYAQGNLEKAVQYFQASLKMVPSIDSRYWLGQCYIKMHDLEKANKELKTIIEIAPESAWGIAAKKSLDSLK